MYERNILLNDYLWQAQPKSKKLNVCCCASVKKVSQRYSVLTSFELKQEDRAGHIKQPRPFLK